MKKGTYDFNNHEQSLSNNQENGSAKEKPEPFWKSCKKKIANRFSVEPIVLILFMAISLSDTLGSELIIKRSCTVTFGHPEENCTGSSVPNIVQSYTTNLLLGKSLIEALFPAVISLFIGPWMDVNGRKPFIIIPLIGSIISFIFWLLLSFVPTLPPAIFLLASLPAAITGGKVAILACSFTYIADKTEENLRAVRMAVVSLFIGLGMLFGNMIAKAYVTTFNNDDNKIALSTYGTAIALLVVNLIYTIFKLKESVKVDQAYSLKDRLYTFFEFDHIKESIKVLFVKRPEHRRTLVLLSIPIIVLTVVIENGENDYLYLVTQAGLSWNLEDFNTYRSRQIIIAICVGIPLLWILKRILKVSELTFLVIIIQMEVASGLLLSFGTGVTSFYIGRVMGGFIDLIKALTKTKLSFLVEATDIGKIFSIISTMENIAPLISAPLYAAMYKAVLAVNPFYYFLLSTALSIVILIFVILASFLQWKYGIKDVIVYK